VLGGREGLDGLLEGAGVLRRERAHGVLDAVPELGQHLVGQVGRELGDEEDADALRADQADGARHRPQEGLRGVVEEQVRLVGEEDQDRFFGVADLRQGVEELGQHPHQEGREEGRALAHVGQVEHRDDPAPVRRRADELRDLHLRLAEEDVAALCLEP
jgi:hypothetical protein